MRTVLNAHSCIAIPLESLFLIDYLRVADRVPLSKIVKQCSREYELKEWGLKPADFDLETVDTLPELIERLHLGYAAFAKSIWGQKTPRMIRHLDLIERFFPGSRYIHVIRDSRAVAASLIRSPVHASTPRHAAVRWRIDVTAGLAFEAQHPDQVMRVHYEDLVSRFPETVQAVCAFLGVQFEPEMLTHQQFREGVYSNRYYRAVHNNLDSAIRPERREAWTQELTPREIATVEAICGPTMEQLGYTTQAAAKPLPVWRTAAARTVGVIRQTSHYLRYRRGYLFGAARRKWVLGLWLRDLQRLSALNR